MRRQRRRAPSDRHRVRRTWSARSAGVDHRRHAGAAGRPVDEGRRSGRAADRRGRAHADSPLRPDEAAGHRRIDHRQRAEGPGLHLALGQPDPRPAVRKRVSELRRRSPRRTGRPRAARERQGAALDGGEGEPHGRRQGDDRRESDGPPRPGAESGRRQLRTRRNAGRRRASSVERPGGGALRDGHGCALYANKLPEAEERLGDRVEDQGTASRAEPARNRRRRVLPRPGAVRTGQETPLLSRRTAKRSPTVPAIPRR